MPGGASPRTLQQHETLPAVKGSGHVPGEASTATTSHVVTLVLTDVEGSTRLWEMHPDLMAIALARHDAIVAETANLNGGTLVKSKGEGDSAFLVFDDVAAAVAAAVGTQRRLLDEPCPEATPLRVRVGVHTAAVQMRDGDFYGTEVNRCARLRGVAHGGQIVLSGVSASLVRDDLPPDVELRDLGSHRLKGLTAPERIYQVCHPALPSHFPPLQSLDVPRHNLPLSLTTLLGREDEVRDLTNLLAQARLVTVLGPGGAGKTRLALEVGRQALERFESVWLCELAPLPPGAPEADIAQRVAAALGVRDEPGRAVLDTVTEHLGAKRVLLVLDNCEHVVDGAATVVAAMLATCPHVSVVTTSRHVLGVGGEQTWGIRALALPAATSDTDPAYVLESPAVQLFDERARLARPGFVLSGDDVAAVAAIVRRLDGMPLAIELAAAWVRSLSPQQIAARLGDRFAMLTHGPRTALPHQRTLRALVDWSHELLSDPERALLRRLAVFAGRFTVEAAEAVCSDPALPQPLVLPLLAQLAEKSLVTPEAGAEVPHYAMLETMREYAAQRLVEAGESDAYRLRFRGWYLDYCEEAGAQLYGPQQGQCMRRLDVEHDNITRALAAASDDDDVDAVYRMAAAIWRFWWIRGHLGEGRGWLEPALHERNATPAVRARALHAAGALAWDQGDFTAARYFLSGALALFAEQHNTRGVAYTLIKLGATLGMQGEFAKGTTMLEEARELGEGTDDPSIVAHAVQQLGLVALQRGEVADARELWEHSHRLFRAVGDTWGTFASLGDQGETAMLMGDHDAARPLLEISLEMAQEMGDTWRVARCSATLGDIARREGDVNAADDLHARALRLRRVIGEKVGIVESLERLAAVALDAGQIERACLVAGAASAQRERLGAPVLRSRRDEHDELFGALRAQPADDADRLLEAGRRLDVDEAVRLALGTGGEVGWAAA